MFLGDFLDEVDLTIEEVGNKMQRNPFKLLPKMIFISARSEAEISGEEFDHTLKDVVKMIEDDGGISSPQVTKFITKWTDSMTGGVPKSEAEEGDSKPKK